MQKKILLTSIFAATLLAGCGSGLDVERKPIDPTIVTQNIKETKPVEDLQYRNNKKFLSYAKDDVITTYLDSGLLIENSPSASRYGFFNVFTGRTIIGGEGSLATFRYNVFRDSNVGFFVKVEKDQGYIMYDSFGNKVAEFNEEKEFLNIYTSKVNDEIYVSLLNNNEATIIKQYSANKTLIKVDSIPSSSSSVDTDVQIFVGEKYIDVNKIDLSECGHDGYYISRAGNLYTTFNKENKALATFSFPSNAKAGLVGDRILVQENFLVSTETNEYDFESEGRKYVLNTYSIDYLKGEVSSIESSYLLKNISPCKDAKGVYTLAIVDLQPIIKNKVLGSKKTLLMDGNMKFIQDISEEYVQSFKKLSNGNFYNTETQVLYDEKLQPISYLSAVSPTLPSANSKFFICRRNSKYGAIDFNGVVVADFDYDEFYSTFEDSILFRKENFVYSVNGASQAVNKIYEGTFNSYGEFSFTKIANHLYKTGEDKDYDMHLCDESGYIFGLQKQKALDLTKLKLYSLQLGIDNYKAVIIAYPEHYQDNDILHIEKFSTKVLKGTNI